MTRRLLAVAAALLVALAGAVAVMGYARTADRRALAGQQALRVYVAAKEVPAGTTAASAVRQKLLLPKLVARAVVPDDVLTSVDDTYGQLVATSVIQPGELVLRSRFAARGTTQGGLLVPEGRLAVSVALDDPSHVGPFVTVGATVAVFDTFNARQPDGTDRTPAGDHLQDEHDALRATRVLLPRVEVLAVGTTTTVAGIGGGAPSDADTASGGKPSSATDPTAATPGGTTLLTLAVSQAQAERLVHGARTGTLTFALLGPGTTATPGQGVDDRTMFEVMQG